MECGVLFRFCNSLRCLADPKAVDSAARLWIQPSQVTRPLENSGAPSLRARERKRQVALTEVALAQRQARGPPSEHHCSAACNSLTSQTRKPGFPVGRCEGLRSLGRTAAWTEDHTSYLSPGFSLQHQVNCCLIFFFLNAKQMPRHLIMLITKL